MITTAYYSLEERNSTYLKEWSFFKIHLSKKQNLFLSTGQVASQSYDNRGGEGPGLWSREPNANPTGPNSYDNRGGEGPGLWSREPNANPTGPNSYDNRGGEGPGLWSQEPNANPTGPNSYDNRGGEGPGLWSYDNQFSPEPNSYSGILSEFLF